MNKASLNEKFAMIHDHWQPKVVAELNGQELKLVKFAGVENRDALDPFRAHFLGVPQDALGPLAEDEVYLHELDGFSVRLEDDTPLGLVSAVYDLPAGILIEVQGPKREFLLPYKKEFVKQVDRAGRRLMVTLPEGLLE